MACHRTRLEPRFPLLLAQAVLVLFHLRTPEHRNTRRLGLTEILGLAARVVAGTTTEVVMQLREQAAMAAVVVASSGSTNNEIRNS